MCVCANRGGKFYSPLQNGYYSQLDDSRRYSTHAVRYGMVRHGTARYRMVSVYSMYNVCSVYSMYCTVCTVCTVCIACTVCTVCAVCTVRTVCMYVRRYVCT